MFVAIFFKEPAIKQYHLMRAIQSEAMASILRQVFDFLKEPRDKGPGNEVASQQSS